MVHVLRTASADRRRLRPGVQARSRRSLERVLAAAESLLSERLFEEVGIAEIARRAGIAVGTAYLRVPSKEALIPALFERHNAAVATRTAAFAQQIASEPRLRARAALLATFAVDYHVRHRGLLRALTTYVRATPDVVPASLFAQREALYAVIARALVGDGRDVAREDAFASALFVLGVVNSVCREQILFADVSPLTRTRGGDAILIGRLTDLIERELAGRVTPLPQRTTR